METNGCGLNPCPVRETWSRMALELTGDFRDNGGNERAMPGSDVDAFISESVKILKQRRLAPLMLREVKEKAERLMRRCSSDDDAICLLIFRDSYIARLEEKQKPGNKAAA